MSTVGLNETTIKKYMQQQEKHDIMQDKPGTRASLRGRWGGKGTGLEQSEGQHHLGAVPAACSYAFLSKFHYKDAGQLQEYMNWNQENDDVEANARRFIKENPELVEEWLKKD